MDQEIITRYIGQPARLPRELRARIEHACSGSSIQLYALADLDHALRLSESWLALTAAHVTLARRDERGEWRVRAIDRAQIRALQETPGLSAHTLALLGEPGDPPLLVVRYTHRQRGAFENLRFVLDEALNGRSVAEVLSLGGSATRLLGGSADERPSSQAAEEPSRREALADVADRVYAAAVARPVRDAQALIAGRESRVIIRLLRYLLPYRRELTFGLAAAAMITLISLAPPYIAGFLIDRVVRPAQDGALPRSVAARMAWVAIAAMAALYLVRQLAAHIRLRYMAVLGEYVARDLRAELYEHIQCLSLSFFSRKKTGSLITRVTADTDRLWEFIAFGVVDVSLSLVMLIGLGGVLLTLDWRLGLVMTLPVPLLCWLIYWHGESLEGSFIRAWRKWSRVTDVLSDTIPGIRVVKAFNQEQREIERFGERNEDVTEQFNEVHRKWTTFWPLLMLAVHTTTVIVWAMAVPRLLGHGAALSAGVFVSFLLYTTMFVAPIEVIGQMARTINRATSSAHRVFEVLDSEPEVRDVPDAIRLEPVQGRVSFENVTFAYDGVRQILRGITFDVAPGELVGLVGPSGGGKTTVVNLIARFYDPTGGVVQIDGADLRRVDAGHYREQIGMVLQDPYLFHGTVLENIRYAMPGATPAAVIAAAKAANAHDFICKLAQGYDTVVGERGHTLSGGERQRISIARAVLHNPRILILDEATSSVDTETERQIQEALDRLIADRTVFAIAHRLSTLRRASRLFVIEKGRLAESGTHQELLAIDGGIYKRLYELQLQLA